MTYLSIFGVLRAFAAIGTEPPKFRLPDTARPNRYAAELTIVPGTDTFHGMIEIQLTVEKPEAVLWLNATGLKIDQASLTAGSSQGAAARIVDGGTNFVGFDFGHALAPGDATLRIVYEGKIDRSSSAGIFQMRDGARPPWYVYSQFEPTDARRAFPCFDEPEFKVPWQLTLHVKTEDVAASNTPVVSETDEDGGMKRVQFAITRPLPSYLIALAVGPFDVVNLGKAGRSKTPLRILMPQGHKGETKFAEAAIPQLLKLLENYFNSPFPFAKLDSVAMPVSDFAMENAGLITYNLADLLSRPDRDTNSRQRECAITAAHEMAHQWFGDLVTPEWWDDIWLNEAFATWMEDKITGEWKPDWKMSLTAGENRLHAMNLDTLVSARRVRQPVNDDSDIANAFDGITYEKGAAIIEMFESWIGSASFQRGVQRYMQLHAGGNATTKDFLTALSEADGRDLGPAFDTFLDQTGAPLVSAELRCDRATPSLALTQTRALPIGSRGSGGSGGSRGADDQHWRIPVCAKYPAGHGTQRECTLLSAASGEMQLTHASTCPAWVLANDGETGYYHVDYRGEMLGRILADRAKHLTLAERVGVLGDIRPLVDFGKLDAGPALTIARQFSQDHDSHIVAQTIDIARIVTGPAVSDSMRPAAEAFVQSVYGRRAHQLGWLDHSGDNENKLALRDEIVTFAASAGNDQGLTKEAQSLANRWLDGNAVDADMDSVLEIAAEHGGQPFFDRLRAAAVKAQDHGERESLIRALASFRDPAIVKQMLGILLTNDFDIREIFPVFLTRPQADPTTRKLPFEFVEQNIGALVSKLPREVGDDFAAMLPESGESFCDASDRDALSGFFEPRIEQFTGGPRLLAQTLERIDLCIARRAALSPALAKFLGSATQSAHFQAE